MNFPATLERARTMIGNVGMATSLQASAILQAQAVGYLRALLNEGLIDQATYAELLQTLQGVWDLAAEALADVGLPPSRDLDFQALIVEHYYVDGKLVAPETVTEGPYHVIGRLPVASFLETMDLTEDEYNRGARHAREMRRIYGPIPASRELAVRVAMGTDQPPVVEVLGWVSDAPFTHDAPAAVALH